MSLKWFIDSLTASDTLGGRLFKTTTLGGVDSTDNYTLSDPAGGRRIKVSVTSASGGSGLFLDGGVMSSTLRNVEDASGTNSVLWLSTTQARINAVAPASATSSLFALGPNDIVAGSANGTYIGINTSSGFTGNIAHWQLNGSDRFKLTSTGIGTFGSHVNSGGDFVATSTSAQFKINDTKLGRGGADGVFQMTNSAETDFTRLVFGSNSSSGVSIVKSSTEIHFKTGNSGSFVPIAIGNAVQSSVATPSTHKVTMNIGGTIYYLLASNV